jgi:hypothetical protein
VVGEPDRGKPPAITVPKARIAESTSGGGGGTNGGTDPQFAACADAKAGGYGP